MTRSRPCAAALLMLLVVVGCAARPTAADKAAARAVDSAANKAMFDSFVMACTNSGLREGTADHVACVLKLTNQYDEMLGGAARRSRDSLGRTTTCQPNFLGGFTCTEY
jgi:hypothetical protein